MARTVGIDLGTTNSVVAFLEGERVESIPNTEGLKTTPSVVMYKGAEDVIVGELAKRQIAANPRQTIRSAKRLIGKRFSDVKARLSDFPYTVVEGEGDTALIQVGDGRYLAPEEVSAEVLKNMRATAEDFLDDEVYQAIITVPAHFNDQQRTATVRAAELAGLEVLRIINEPTAAALAYGMGKGKDEVLAVFDFGGGTFNVSILQLNGGIFEVLSTGGDNHLGGDDIDQRLFEEIAGLILAETKIDPKADLAAVQRLREAAEKAKCELSTLQSTVVSLPFIVADATGPKHFQMDLNRTRFNELMEPLFERLLVPCKTAIADARLKPADIKTVLLVGGSTRIPRVQELVRRFFGKEPNRSVNPDEAVALGAAIQAGVLKGELQEVLLLDVTPLSLGIELAGGVFKTLIPRNSTVPCQATHKFTTVVDNQKSVLVHVLQGERAKASENHSLARFRLEGIQPAPKELPEIQVKFSIDANGILEVSAVDLSSGMHTGISVEGYGQLAPRSPEAIRAVLDAAKAATAEDERFLQFTARRQQILRLQDDMNHLLEEAGNVVDEGDLRAIKETLLRIDLALEAQDVVKLDQFEDLLLGMKDKYRQARQVHVALNRHHASMGLPSSAADVSDRRSGLVELPQAAVAPSQPSTAEVPKLSEAATPRPDAGPPPPPPPSPAQTTKTPMRREDAAVAEFDLAKAPPPAPPGSLITKDLPARSVPPTAPRHKPHQEVFPVTKAAVAALLMQKTGLGRKEAILAVEAFLDSVKDALKSGEKVSLVGFGTFLVKTKDPRNGRNPRTGEQIHIPEKKVAIFKPGKSFRELVSEPAAAAGDAAVAKPEP